MFIASQRVPFPMHSVYSEKMNLSFADGTGQIQKSDLVLPGSACEITSAKLAFD